MVKRFSVILDRITRCECGVRGDSRGDYVLFTDYESIKRERDGLVEKVALMEAREMAGKALVPVEATDEMIDSACDASNLYRVDFIRAWDAAIKAAKGE